MNIKSVLKIVILCVVIISATFAVSIYSLLENYQNALNKTNIATDLVFEIVQRRLLAEEYMRSHNDRPKEQWFSKQAKIKAFFAQQQNKFRNPEEQEQILNIKNGLQGSEETFVEIVALFDKTDNATPSATMQEQERRLDSQLGIKSQETIIAAGRLKDFNRDNLDTLLNRIIGIFSIASSLYLIMLLVSFWIIRKSVLDVELGDARFHFISQATNDAVYDWDITKNKIWFGEGMQKSFGYKTNQIQDQLDWWNSHIHPEDKTRVNSLIHEMLSGKQNSTTIHYRFQKSNNTYADVVDKGYLVRDSQGKPIRYISVMQDMTKERELARMKDEFVSIASHELRTPMTAIRGLVSMIFEGDFGPIPDSLKPPLSDVEISTSKLIDLVNDLLDVARIEAGRTKFVITDIPINTLINPAISLLQPLAKTKDIELTAQSIPDISIQGDSSKIQEILNNIVGNALKFTDKGSITIIIKEEDELAKIFVTDTGIGISPESQQKLFGKFEQVTSQKAGRPAGTGLGLYISKALAQKMGGDVWIERSEIGVGTTFGFSIPVANSSKADTIKKAVAQEASFHPDQK